MATRIRFSTDEHVARAVVQGLRERGVDVLTAAEVGLLGARDDEHMRRAREAGRTIFTHDTDFLRLHAPGADHAGIVYAPPQTPIGETIRGLVLNYEGLEPSEMQRPAEFL